MLESWYIKHENGRVLMQDKIILDMWIYYFKNLLNGKSKVELSVFRHEVRHLVFHRRDSAKEVRETLKMVKLEKTVELDEISIDVWKFLGKVGIQVQTKLFNRILDTGKLTEY